VGRFGRARLTWYDHFRFESSRSSCARGLLLGSLPERQRQSGRAACPLCDQEDKNINHLLVSCVFSDSFGTTFCSGWAWLLSLSKPFQDNLDEWWSSSVNLVDGSRKIGFNSLAIVEAWAI
jgi:hypothetical protein